MNNFGLKKMFQNLSKKILLAAVLLPGSSCLVAQTFSKTIPNSSYYSIVQLSTGELVLAGQKQSFDTAMVVSKYTTGGHHISSRYVWHIGGVSIDDAHANNLLYNDNDSLLLSIYVSSGAQGGTLGAVSKLDNNAAIGWYNRYKVGNPSGNVRGGIAATYRPKSSDNYVNVGWTNPAVTATSIDYGGVIQKTDLNGIPVWSKFFQTSFQFFFAVTDGADYNSYTVAGGSGFARILNVDTAGNTNWSYSFKAGGTNTEILGLKTTEDSCYIHVGNHVRAGGSDKNAYIMKMDRNADIIWAYSVGGNSEDNFTNVITTSDGGYLAVGKTGSYGSGGTDAWLVKFSSEGTIEWTRTAGKATADELLYNVIEGKDGSYFAVGKEGVNSILIAVKNNGYLSCGSSVSPTVTDIKSTSAPSAVSYATSTYSGYLSEQGTNDTLSFIAHTDCTLEDIAVVKIRPEYEQVFDCADIAFEYAVKNDGNDTLRDIIIGYSINNVIVGYDTVSTAIAPGTLHRAVFNRKWSPVPAGTYNARAFIVGAWDEYLDNDTLAHTFQVSAFAAPLIQRNGNTLSAVSAYESYQWLLNGNPINGANGSTYTPSADGSYSLSVKSNNCEATSDTIIVEGLSIDRIGNDNNIKIYPIPFHGSITLETEGTAYVALYSLDGKRVWDGTCRNSITINTESLHSGVYVLQTTTEQGHVIIRKIVKL